MADVVLGVARSLLEGTITKAQAAIEESSRLQESAQRDLLFIAGEFEMMQAFLGAASTEEHVANTVVATWVAQVLDLAYDVEDGIEFVVHLDGESDWLRRLIPPCLRRRPLPLDEAVAIIKQLKARVQDVYQRKERYKLMGDSAAGGASAAKQMSQKFELLPPPNNVTLYGRMSEINQLCGYLAKARIHNSPVVSVWGMPGVGKSALVKNVCDKMVPEGGFEKHAWVHVSHPFDLNSFCRSLLFKFGPNDDDDAGRDPVEECRRLLSRHAYLVVIKGLQSPQECDAIGQAALVSRLSRSVFVVITDEDTIALQSTGRKDLVFNVNPLGVRAAIDLFKTKAQVVIEKGSVLWQLVSKCGGLPEVIVVIAEFLGKCFNWAENARILNDNFLFNLETRPEFSSLRGLLNWMHSHLGALPRDLRKLVAYLLIFPGDSSIRRRRLVMRWGAEGYSRDNESHTADENGEELFSALVKQTMIQPPPLTTTTNMRLVSFEVNAIFREYMISRPDQKENIATAIELFALKGSCSPTSRRRGRHLVIEQSWARDRIVFENIDFSRLRSLTVFGKWEAFFVSECMKVLRVLDLEDASGVNNKDLQNMLDLLPRLKFLSLRGCSNINYLPSSVGKLRQLQVLDVRYTNIVTTPMSITKLRKLQYFRAGPPMATCQDPSAPPTVALMFSELRRYLQLAGVKVMSGIGKLTALNTLGVINVSGAGGKVILKELRDLTQLRKLEVSGVSKKNGKDFCSAVLCHSRLQSLSVWLSKDNQDCLDGMVSENTTETSDSEPANRLQSLKLYGPVVKLPMWINKLYELRKLNLEISTLSEGDVKILGGLRELCILRLYVNNLQKDGVLSFYVRDNGLECSCYKKIKVLEQWIAAQVGWAKPSFQT
ncbi:hypothetical protein BS78_05G123800 [Paspalum vaginatum]|nr:hypothetical protein BS78_05G123800 [Paspalum vaginatum]KAJ1275274.1 hypothetical protein BS78_05G123800 [Paspalum vaginatum]KAJ1275275.1 hypothetical protein BS78_05G123800 [Paspalum vaginatum]